MDKKISFHEVDKQAENPKRNLYIQISEDRLEAYITIEYQSVTIKDSAAETIIAPPVYKELEIKDELLKAGVVYGIILENLKQCTKPEGVYKQLVARGDREQNGEDDKLNIKFDIDSTIKKLHEDEKGNVNFKSIGSVKSVKKGEVIAEKLNGKAGTDGKDIKGRIIKHKDPKKVILKAGKGCEIVNDTIVATIDGKPCMKNGNFYVFSVHEIQGDVDLKTGNIVFSGDIIIHGNVNEGMEIHSGNSIIIKGYAERSQITAYGDLLVNGNTLASKLTSGGEDSEKLKVIDSITSLNKNLKDMLAAVEEMKKLNLLGDKVNDGQIIKLLLESKFKEIIKFSIRLLGALSSSQEQKDIRIVELIKNKLMALGPISIKHYSELGILYESLEEKAISLQHLLSIPVNVKLAYVQDSTVCSSGDIIVAGKGSYLSHLYANGSIIFTQDKSMVRGGILNASKEINCKTVGSTSGTHTKLIVKETGHVYIDIAYGNTAITVGKREYVIDHDSRNVHAYINKDGELNIDRLKL